MFSTTCRHEFRLDQRGLRQLQFYLRSISHDAQVSQRRLWPRKRLVAVTIGIVSASYISYRLWDRKQIDKTVFVPYKLESRTPLTSTSSILTLLPSEHAVSAPQEEWQVSSIQIKQPELNIARFYTPLPRSHGEEKRAVELLVRHYPGGELSTYLSRLPPGAAVHIRGSYPELALPDCDEVDDIVFLAGGTGIAPALQLAENLRLKAERNGQPRLHLLWAVQSQNECAGLEQKGLPAREPPSRFLQWLYPAEPAQVTQKPNALTKRVNSLSGNLTTVGVFPDDGPHNMDEALLREVLFPSKLKQSQAKGRRKIVIVSGPDGFVNALAGQTAASAYNQETQRLSVRSVGGMLGACFRSGEKIKTDAKWEIYRL